MSTAARGRPLKVKPLDKQAVPRSLTGLFNLLRNCVTSVGLMSTIINPNLSIPKLIKIEVDEFQSVSTERDNNINMEMKMENLVRERDWLKKEVDLLEKTQSFTELEKCSVEEKLERSERRCQEFDEKFVQMEEIFAKLRQKEIDSEKAVQFYNSRGDDLEPRLLKVEETLAKLLNVDFVKLDKFAAAAVDIKAE